LTDKKNKSHTDLEKLRTERREHTILKDMEEADYMEVRDINLKDKEEKEKRLKETKIKIEKFKNDKEADPTY